MKINRNLFGIPPFGILLADGEGNDGGKGGPDPAGTGGGGSAADDKNGGDDGKKFTQADIDRIVGREKKSAAEAARKEMQAEIDKKNLSDTERLQAEKDEALKKGDEKISVANQRVIKAEAKVQALALGLKPERVEAALRLADLSGITVGDDGEPESAAIKTALEKVKADYPEFTGGQVEKVAKAGSEMITPQAGDKPLTQELINKMPKQELKRRNAEILGWYAQKKKR